MQVIYALKFLLISRIISQRKSQGHPVGDYGVGGELLGVPFHSIRKIPIAHWFKIYLNHFLLNRRRRDVYFIPRRRKKSCLISVAHSTACKNDNSMYELCAWLKLRKVRVYRAISKYLKCSNIIVDSVHVGLDSFMLKYCVSAVLHIILC